ncbi:hypothetical protein FRC08_016308 [Ceratobasidium sp. 394]|nr:hypothetical protein FRC08_016308 [Ceratobasidium sp. 394]
MSALGSLSNSISGSKKQEPKSIHFPTGRWYSGPMFEWYNGPSTLRNIDKLQIRKEDSRPVPHRFIIAYMVSEDRTRTSIYRFDRRPSVSASAVVGATLLNNDSGLAKDEYIVDVEPSSFQSAQCEVEICFQGRVDLISIITACYAIAQDKQARNYSLQKYNCFFFSWTILMLVSREQLPYTMPAVNLVESRVLRQLPRLTETIVDEVISVFQDIILAMTSTFHTKSTGDLVAGMSLLERAIWSLPTQVIQVFLKQMFRLQLHMGLRGRLIQHMTIAIKQRIEIVWSATMSTHLTPELLNHNLWPQDMNEVIRPRSRLSPRHSRG